MTLPQIQNPLFSVLPPKLRTRVFELAVTHEDGIEVPLYPYRKENKVLP